MAPHVQQSTTWHDITTDLQQTSASTHHDRVVQIMRSMDYRYHELGSPLNGNGDTALSQWARSATVSGRTVSIQGAMYASDPPPSGVPLTKGRRHRLFGVSYDSLAAGKYVGMRLEMLGISTDHTSSNTFDKWRPSYTEWTTDLLNRLSQIGAPDAQDPTLIKMKALVPTSMDIWPPMHSYHEYLVSDLCSQKSILSTRELSNGWIEYTFKFTHT